MAPDLPLELDDRRDPAMLRASDPLVEVLLGKIGILEREHGLETSLQPVPSRQGPVLRLDHRQPLALPFRQVLLVLAEGVFRVLELFDRLLRLLDLGPEPVLSVGLGLLRLPRLPLQVEQGDAGASPRVQPDRVQCVVGPFHDMERVDAAVRVRAVLLHRVGDPTCAVPGDDEDRLALLRGQLVEEEVQHLLAVPLVRPDDGVGVVVDDDRDVAVALAVARLVDADPHESVEPLLHVRLQLVPDEVDEPSDRVPVDPQMLGDLLLAEPAFDHPCRREREISREARSGLRPRNRRRRHAVFRAGHARDGGADPHRDGAEVHAAPERLGADVVVDIAFPAADGAPPPVLPADMNVHDERGFALRVLVEVEGVDRRLLDVEEILQ